MMDADLIKALALFVGVLVLAFATAKDSTHRKKKTQRHWKPRNKGAKYEKMGREFEQYIITRFDKGACRLVEWRSDKYIPGWGGPDSCRDPDLVFEDRASGERFAIECKYRSRVFGRQIEWARPDQLTRYRDFGRAQKLSVYIAIGIGGKPSAPKDLFIVNLNRMKFPWVMRYYLEKFRVRPDFIGLEFG